MSVSLSEQIIKMQVMLDTAKKEVHALEGGKKSSSARARKSLQNIKTSSHIMRKNITEHSKTIPVKKRVPKPAVAEPVADPPSEPVVIEPTEATDEDFAKILDEPEPATAPVPVKPTRATKPKATRVGRVPKAQKK